MSPEVFTEAALVEEPALALLRELDWEVVNAYRERLGPEGTLGRDSIHDVVLTHRLRDALSWLNPQVPAEVREKALEAVTKNRLVMDPTRANQEVYQLLRNGYQGEWQDQHDETQHATVHYIDFGRSDNNDWLAASQVWIAGELHRRRPDLVLFVNGIPLVLFEFKEPSRGGVHGEPHRLPGNDSRTLLAQCVRAPVEWFGGQGRGHLRTLGSLRRLDGHRRDGQTGCRGTGDGDPRHLRS